FTLSVPAQTSIVVRARAEMLRDGAPGWSFRVVDNTADGALYVLDSPAFDSGAAGGTRDLVAGSGWTGSAYTSTRAAAPFAILDDLFDGKALILTARPAAEFPPLTVHWSAENRPATGSIASGDIGTSFYRRTDAGERQIFLLGDADNDTDEYDRHVVTHEWGHYVEDVFSRSDSVGGPHGQGDVLDPRVAFGEGFGNAFAAMVLNDPVFRDTLGQRQSFGFGDSIEDNASVRPGWFSRDSVEAILYDLFDATADGVDTVNLGFAPLFAVLTGAQRDSDYFTTIFTFIAALKAAQPGQAAQIDTLVSGQAITATMLDAQGSTETNDAGNADDVLPVYTTVQVDGDAGRVCSIAGLAPAFGTVNKLSNRRFVAFEVPLQGSYRIVATAVPDPLLRGANPDFVLHRRGAVAIADDELGAVETLITRALPPGVHLLEVYERSNTTETPRGRTCIDVTVSGL
ncbi:MAG: hypothetical protein AAGD86_12180, partial [Pseudomonadota bacterium]